MRSRAVCRTAAPCCAGAVAEQAAAAPGPSALVRDGDDDLRRGEDRSDRTTSPATPTPPTSFADVLNALPPALADYIQDLCEIRTPGSGRPRAVAVNTS